MPTGTQCVSPPHKSSGTDLSPVDRLPVFLPFSAPGINSAGKPLDSFSHREELTNSTFLRRKTGPSRYPTPESLEQVPEEPLDALAPKLALPSKGTFSGPTARPTPPARMKQENQRLKLATNPRPFVESWQPPEDLGEGLPGSLDEKPTVPVGDGRESSLSVTSHSSLQISPFTVLPVTRGPGASPRGVTETLEEEAGILPNNPPQRAEDEAVKGGSSSREEGREATPAIISTPEQLPSK